MEQGTISWVLAFIFMVTTVGFIIALYVKSIFADSKFLNEFEFKALSKRIPASIAQEIVSNRLRSRKEDLDAAKRERNAITTPLRGQLTSQQYSNLMNGHNKLVADADAKVEHRQRLYDNTEKLGLRFGYDVYGQEDTAKES